MERCRFVCTFTATLQRFCIDIHSLLLQKKKWTAISSRENTKHMMSRMKSLLALQPVIAAGCLFVFLLLRVGLQMDYVIVCFLLGKEGAVPVAKGVSSEHLLSTHNNKLEHRKNHVLFWNPPSPYRHNTPIRVNRSPSIWVELDWICQPQEHMALHMNGLFKEHHSQIFLAWSLQL